MKYIIFLFFLIGCVGEEQKIKDTAEVSEEKIDDGSIHINTEEFAPLNYSDKETGEIKGFATEIVKKVFENAKIPYKLRIYPWARAYNNTLKKSNHLIFSMGRNDKREKLFKWVFPVSQLRWTKLYRKRNGPPQSNVKNVKEGIDTKGIFVAVRNSDQEAALQKLGVPKEQIQIVDSYPQMWKMIQKERVHFALGGKATPDNIKEAGLTMDAIEEVEVVRSVQNFLGANLELSEEIFSKLRKSYDELLDKGEIQLPE